MKNEVLRTNHSVNLADPEKVEKLKAIINTYSDPCECDNYMCPYCGKIGEIEAFLGDGTIEMDPNDGRKCQIRFICTSCEKDFYMIYQLVGVKLMEEVTIPE